jgi:predicted nucleic acid-binding protein
VNEEKILTQLYSGKIVIPQQVYNELSFPRISHLKRRLDVLINGGDAVVQPILTDTPEFILYSKYINSPDKGHNIIGKGEASALALASVKSGAIASNNLKDVAVYVSELNIRHITTGDILVEALEASLITVSDGNSIWNAMLARKRKIGSASFTDYIHSKRN